MRCLPGGVDAGIRPPRPVDRSRFARKPGYRIPELALNRALARLPLPPGEFGAVVLDDSPQPPDAQSTNSRYTIGAESPRRGPIWMIRV